MDSFHTLLRATLSDYSNDGLRLDEVAGKLRLSPRTLQRRLAEYGTTWRAELEGVRRDTAVALLSDRGVAVETIAAQLGYRDRRVLARAFRRWTGQSPAEFRRALSN
ncbi:helix-turn-helix transcriptional regulator [Nocardia concava]|uniref:helix-turn-helix transcriptional regulator n=1 Tax=Nocardia concava TaxID=257281 RepID=UPI0002F7C525|nr:helix-turn-helix transcriptional regulator [Nocardia concava]